MCWIFVKCTYLRLCWRSTIDLCLMNLPKRSSFKRVLKVYTLSKIFVWKMRATTAGACIKLGWLARRPLCYKVNLRASREAQRLLRHKVNLLSCVARRPKCARVNLPSSCSSAAAVIPQRKSTEMWSSAAPFHHEWWYFRLWTNEHFSSMLFIRNFDQPKVAPLKPLK